MEMVDGEPLTGPLPLARALEFASQILSALDAAHRKGITHRDLKPGNILVTKQGVKLLDFGLAKLDASVGTGSMGQSVTHAPSESPTGLQTLTGEHTILGTVQYMSPEQAQGKPADARSDIFSFGLVLYEMLTGKRAFDGTNPASVIAAILERDAPSVAGVAPPALDRVLRRCLVKDPDDRWQSARDISHAIAMVDDPPAGAGHARTKRWTMAVASLLGFVTASAIGVALWTTWPQPQTDRHPLSFHLTPPPSAEFLYSPNEGGGIISPDGQSVAFVAVTNGTPRLWIRALDSLTARELQGTDGAKFPFWSPDSRAIGFFTHSDLRRIDVSGAAPVVIARALDSRGGTWNADGTIVFSPNSIGPLHQVSDTGKTTPTPLTALSAGETSHRFPKFLPDSRTLLYFVQGQKAGVYLTTLDRPDDTKRVSNNGSEATYVRSQNNRPGYLLWVARDTVMAQPFDPASAQLMGAAVAVPGTKDVASSVAMGRASLSVSNDGTLLYSTGGSRYQLAWFGRDGTPRGTLGPVDEYIRAAPLARRPRGSGHHQGHDDSQRGPLDAQSRQWRSHAGYFGGQRLVWRVVTRQSAGGVHRCIAERSAECEENPGSR